MITRCPSCLSLFKLVPDQLRVAGGWVRCGRCGSNFDAYINAYTPPGRPDAEDPWEDPDHADDSQGPQTRFLLPLDRADKIDEQEDPDAFSAVNPLDLEASDTMPQTAARQRSDHTRLASQMPDDPLAIHSQASPGTPGAAPDDAQIQERVRRIKQIILRQLPLPDPDMDPDFAISMPAGLNTIPPSDEHELAIDSAGAKSDIPGSTAAMPDKSHAPAPDPAPSAARPAFVASAQKRAFWRRPLVRLVLLLAACVLILAALLQWAYHKRSWLATAHPQIQPWLQQMCRMLDCEIAPLIIPDAVVISHSALDTLADGQLRMEITLRNRSAMRVAAPALEISLNDSQNQALIRKAVQASELGLPPVLDPLGQASATRLLALSSPVSEAAVRNYQINLFYP